MLRGDIEGKSCTVRRNTNIGESEQSIRETNEQEFIKEGIKRCITKTR